MSDNKSTRGPADASRINVHEDYELRYWSQKFGVTAEEIKSALKTAGVMAKDVEAQLKKSS